MCYWVYSTLGTNALLEKKSVLKGFEGSAAIRSHLYLKVPIRMAFIFFANAKKPDIRLRI